MIRSFEIEQYQNKIVLSVDPLEIPYAPDNNFYAVVVYDNPNPPRNRQIYGTPEPDLEEIPTELDYYSWIIPIKNGVGEITNDKLYPKQLKAYKIDDYTTLRALNLYIITKSELYVLNHTLARIDLVHRRYPEVFNKKFTIEEILLFIEAALLDIDLLTPVTNFWFTFDTVLDDEQMITPTLLSTMSTRITSPTEIFGGIPAMWIPIITKGAIIQALLSQGLLEVDINFQLNDGSVSISYDNASTINTWFSHLVQQYQEERKQAKMPYMFKGLALGTLPYAAGWLPIMITHSSWNDVSGYPWFMFSGGLGRPF